jgi:protein-disulfide isomerase
MEQSTKKWHKKWWAIILFLLATIILIFLIAFGFYIYKLTKLMKTDDYQALRIINSIPPKTDEKMLRFLKTDDNFWLGPPNPKLTIVSFIDYNCPLSKNFFFKIRAISHNYKNYVKIINRDYPLYDTSVEKAMAARCAGEQGLYWLMHDKLFLNNAANKNDLNKFAYQIGADMERFSACMASNKYFQNIQKDFSDAESLNIAGTPTFFINGQKIEGDIPEILLNQIINQLIK